MQNYETVLVTVSGIREIIVLSDIYWVASPVIEHLFDIQKVPNLIPAKGILFQIVYFPFKL